MALIKTRITNRSFEGVKRANIRLIYKHPVKQHRGYAVSPMFIFWYFTNLTCSVNPSPRIWRIYIPAEGHPGIAASAKAVYAPPQPKGLTVALVWPATPAADVLNNKEMAVFVNSRKGMPCSRRIVPEAKSLGCLPATVWAIWLFNPFSFWRNHLLSPQRPSTQWYLDGHYPKRDVLITIIWISPGHECRPCIAAA